MCFFQVMKPAFVTASAFVSQGIQENVLFFLSLKVFFVSQLSVDSETLVGTLEEEQLGNLN